MTMQRPLDAFVAVARMRKRILGARRVLHVQPARLQAFPDTSRDRRRAG
jgi:hypothetical protein